MSGLALLTTQQWHPVLSARELPQFEAKELPFGLACSEVDQVCAAWTNRLAIGWEAFTINSETHKKTREGINDAMHVIGVCRYLTDKHGCRFLGEAHQHTPGPDDRDRLRRLGWWVPGKDDAQSAACHMLRWLKRSGELTPEQRVIAYGV
jgi:hypothetical protein